MSSSAPLASVVVPSFNHARYLEDALRSVAAQNHEALELIVVDDASSDASVQVARAVLEEPSVRDRFAGRVQLLTSPTTRGAHAAINRGLEAAGGAILTVLNSDDRYAPDRIRELAAALRQTGSMLAFSRVEYIDESSQPLPASGDVFRLRRHQAGIDRAPSVGFACMCSNVAISSDRLSELPVMGSFGWEGASGIHFLRYHFFVLISDARLGVAVRC